MTTVHSTLDAEVKRLEQVHEINRTAYRAALAVQRVATAEAAALSDVAFVSANELAAAKDALAALEKGAKRKPTVQAVGAPSAGPAETK